MTVLIAVLSSYSPVEATARILDCATPRFSQSIFGLGTRKALSFGDRGFIRPAVRRTWCRIYERCSNTKAWQVWQVFLPFAACRI
jgi:hypothetical protein